MLRRLAGPMIRGFSLVLVFSVADLPISVRPDNAIALAGQLSEGQRLVQQLIEGARKEGALDVFASEVLSDKSKRSLEQSFNRRFGLNIKLNIDNSTTEGPKFSQAMVEMQTGVPPTFDVMQGAEDRILLLQDAGGIQKVDSWEVLLREISPEAFKVRDQISPMTFAGYAFQWVNRMKVINYNPQLISEDELPQTRAELGNPKFKGMYSLPSFISETLYGILVYPRDRWLEIVRSWSRWKPPVVHYGEGVKRLLLGQLKFLPSNEHYVFEIKHKDANAPIAMSFFRDLTPKTYSFYFVRKGTRHPNAATLFALWTTSPEANRSFENSDLDGFTVNLSLGTGPFSQRTLQMIKTKKPKVLSWFDSEESFKTFRWYATSEGKRYAKELIRAQTGRE